MFNTYVHFNNPEPFSHVVLIPVFDSDKELYEYCQRLAAEILKRYVRSFLTVLVLLDRYANRLEDCLPLLIAYEAYEAKLSPALRGAYSDDQLWNSLPRNEKEEAVCSMAKHLMAVIKVNAKEADPWWAYIRDKLRACGRTDVRRDPFFGVAAMERPREYPVFFDAKTNSTEGGIDHVPHS